MSSMGREASSDKKEVNNEILEGTLDVIDERTYHALLRIQN